MKRLQQFISLTSVFVLTALHNPVSISAQTTLAIRGGVSRATMSGLEEEGVDLDPRIGLSLGASATIPLQDNFGLRLDGGYVQKGQSGKEDGLEVNLFLDYIELSGTGIVSLTPSESPASIYAFAGPSFGFNTKCEASARVSGIEGVEDLGGSTSCGDDVSGIDLGITAGIGADMAIAEGMTFSVNLRYTLGLTNVDKAGEDDLKNRNLSILAGVGFPIGE